jgi:hypothetical protein
VDELEKYRAAAADVAEAARRLNAVLEAAVAAGLEVAVTVQDKMLPATGDVVSRVTCDVYLSLTRADEK